VIKKGDILERAREWRLRADVVEKDYVLGWLLAAIAQHEEAASDWVFKGGTCVKKCFFETYRFSEDLDFTLTPDAAYTETELRDILSAITTVASELSGVTFSADTIDVRPRKDKQGRATFQGRVGYQGPLGAPGWPRILFDLTRHEPIIDEPVLRPVHHPYPDPIPSETVVQTYSFEELLAEKLRALCERARPRDLYDVVYIIENGGPALRLDHVREVFADKCAVKELAVPSAAGIIALVRAAPEISTEWANMLGHQLPYLPAVDVWLGRLPAAVVWVDPKIEVVASTELAILGVAAGEVVIAADGVQHWGGGIPLETIRFAGANRLVLRCVYSGKQRSLEPYSLRRSRPGNLLLYAHEIESDQIKAFTVAKIEQLTVSDQIFAARHQVEFTATGALDTWIPVSTRLSAARSTWRVHRASPRAGPAYVYQCHVCHREFRHRTRDASLRRHRIASGSHYCTGRRGAFVKTE
jgi:predicted nucleotidyltransferase component of viral defense system